jgi:predicted aspartyl protease
MFKTALALIIIFATGFHVGAAGTMVPLSLSADGIVTVEAVINGAGPFRLMLDTGSNRSAVSSRLARSLRLTPVATSSMVTAGGTQQQHVVHLTRLTLGTVAKHGLLVPVLDNSAMESVGAGVDGILGQDFLLDQNYTLDYEHRRLAWNAAASTASAPAELALVEAEGRWLVSLPQTKNEPAARFVPDSGAAGLIVFDRGAALPVPTAPLPVTAQLTTLTGSTSSRAVLVSKMAIGAIVWKNRPALVIDRRDPAAPAGDGLLPLSAFASVTFDAGRRVMTVRSR